MKSSESNTIETVCETDTHKTLSDNDIQLMRTPGITLLVMMYSPINFSLPKDNTKY